MICIIYGNIERAPVICENHSAQIQVSVHPVLYGEITLFYFSSTEYVIYLYSYIYIYLYIYMSIEVCMIYHVDYIVNDEATEYMYIHIYIYTYRIFAHNFVCIQWRSSGIQSDIIFLNLH